MADYGSRTKTVSPNIAKFRELGLLGFIVILSLMVQIRNPSFLTWENINDMATNTAILSILTVGMMLVIVTRGIDLSIGATLARQDDNAEALARRADGLMYESKKSGRNRVTSGCDAGVLRCSA